MTTEKKPLIQVTLDPAVRTLLELIAPAAPAAPGRRLRLLLDLAKSPRVREALIDEAARRGWINK